MFNPEDGPLYEILKLELLFEMSNKSSNLDKPPLLLKDLQEPHFEPKMSELVGSEETSLLFDSSSVSVSLVSSGFLLKASFIPFFRRSPIV